LEKLDHAYFLLMHYIILI